MVIILPDITPGGGTETTNDPVDSTPTGYQIAGVDINKYLQIADTNVGMPTQQFSILFTRNGNRFNFVKANSTYTNGLTPPKTSDVDPLIRDTYTFGEYKKNVFTQSWRTPFQRRGYNPVLRYRLGLTGPATYKLRWVYKKWCDNYYFDYGTLQIFNEETEQLLTTYESPVPPLILGLIQGAGGGGAFNNQSQYTAWHGGAGGTAVPFVLSFPRSNRYDVNNTYREAVVKLGDGGAAGTYQSSAGGAGGESWIGISSLYKELLIPGGSGGTQNGGGSPVSATWGSNLYFVKPVATNQQGQYINEVPGGRGDTSHVITASLYMANCSEDEYKILYRSHTGGGLYGGGASFLSDGGAQAVAGQDGSGGGGGGQGAHIGVAKRGGHAALLLYW